MLVVELVDAHARPRRIGASSRRSRAPDQVGRKRSSRHATAAVRAIGKPVKLEAAIFCGPVGDALVKRVAECRLDL